ncbi:hypothetical protein MKW92_035652 [Papaver armeniacum]|nr:hypothetical protein MKW92_035652 [Papaver armeniacum]
MLRSSGYYDEFPADLVAKAVEESKSRSRESPEVSSVSIDSMISTMRNEEGYPVGLKVLVVDQDLSFLEEIKPMLLKCKYEGTMCSSASEALSMLRYKNCKFDIILMAILDNDMEGFKQIQQLAMEADLPIRYLLPKDTSSPDVQTANDVLGRNASKLFKPIGYTSVQSLWFPVAEKRVEYIRKLVKAELIDRWDGSVISKLLYSRRGDDGSFKKLVELIQKVEEEGEDSMNVEVEEHDTSLFPNKKPKIQEGEYHMDVKVEEHHTSLFLIEKPKIPWMASNLHEQFIMAVYQLGTDKADAAKILERMNSTDELTRKDVDIHLKEFRFLCENSARGHPSDMPFNEKAKPLRSFSRGFKDDLCGSFNN